MTTNGAHVHTIDHPLAQHALGLVRNAATPRPMFKHAVAEITRQLVQSATADLATASVTVQTPMAEAVVHKIDARVSVVAILRSGAAMLETAMEAIPDSRAGHFGIYHDKRVGATVEYYLKLPKDAPQSRVLLLDPAIGTGKTALACLSRLEEFGATDIHFLTLIASREGVATLGEEFPNVHIHAVATSDTAGDEGYLIPGMGDFGDRYYGSK